MPGKVCPHMDLLVTVENMYLLLQLPETLVWYWTTSYAAPQTSPWWPDPAENPADKHSHNRLFLTREAAQLLVQALVISRLDYCNSFLAGLPVSVIKPLHPERGNVHGVQPT